MISTSILPFTGKGEVKEITAEMGNVIPSKLQYGNCSEIDEKLLEIDETGNYSLFEQDVIAFRLTANNKPVYSRYNRWLLKLGEGKGPDERLRFECKPTLSEAIIRFENYPGD